MGCQGQAICFATGDNREGDLDRLRQQWFLCGCGYRTQSSETNYSKSDGSNHGARSYAEIAQSVTIELVQIKAG
jgi:hypothetical protein